MKRTSTLFISAVLGMLTQGGWAQTFEAGGNTYTPTGDTTVELTKAGALTGEYTIPETVSDGNRQYTVTSLGDEAFSMNRVERLVMPSTITSIGKHCFYFCTALTDVELSENLGFIGDEAFIYDSSLASEIVLPAGVEVGEKAFYGCSSVSALTLNGAPKSVGTLAFRMDRLRTFTVKSTTPPQFSPAEAIQEYDDWDEEYNIELSTITLLVPKGCVEAYQADANWKGFVKMKEIDAAGDKPQPVEGTLFVETAGTLKELISPEEKGTTTKLALSGVLNGDDILFLREMCGTSLDGSGTGFGALEELDLTHAHIVAGGEAYYSYIDTYYTEDDECGDHMFSSCLTLKKLLLPKDNTRVGAECFSGDSQLTEVSLGDRVRSIGEQAFYHTFVENVYIPDCCEVIDDMAFYDVETLKTVHLPAALKKLNFGVFYFCKQLDGVVIPDGVEEIEDLAFFDCESLQQINIPAATTEVEYHAFNRCYSLKRFNVAEDNPVLSDIDGILFDKDQQILQLYPVAREDSEYTLPETCVALQSNAFWQANNLKRVVMDEAMTIVGNGAFDDCQNLEEVVFSDNVTSIGVEAFFGCKKLTHVDLPAGLTTLEREAFMSSGLKSLVLPEQISVVPEALCYGCTALSEVVLPATCTRLEESAFYGCTALRRLEVNAVTPPEVDYTTYEDEEGQSEDVISCFHDVDYANCLLVVPAGSEEAYAAHKVWGMFNQIVSDGIDGVSQSDNHAAIHAYDVLGRRLGTAVRSGLQIVRQQDGSVRKVVVR